MKPYRGAVKINCKCDECVKPRPERVVRNVGPECSDCEHSSIHLIDLKGEVIKKFEKGVKKWPTIQPRFMEKYVE